MACVADREAAVREVADVYELIKVQQPLLHSQQLPPSTTTQLAQSLLGEALRALNVALSVMKQQQPVVIVKAEPQLSAPSPASGDSPAAIAPSTATTCSKRRRSSVAMEAAGKKKTSSSWSTVTAAPYDDGYEWRKYGEKKINGAGHTRNYFRCTYKDDAGCLATKHVQQMDNNSNNQLMYHVIYNNDHTCSAKAAAKSNTGSSSNNNLAALLADCCNGSGNGLTTTTINARPTGHAAAAAMNMKQEPKLLLPALIDLQPSACFPHEQIPQCQQEPLFATSKEQLFFCGASRDRDAPFDGEIPSATGSCISGETSWWDGDMVAQMASEEDPLRNLDRFLHCDSFMDYQF